MKDAIRVEHWECPAHLGLGSLGHVQGEEVGLRERLLPADQLHPQGRCLDLGRVGVVRNHVGKAQADASSGNLAAHLRPDSASDSAGMFAGYWACPVTRKGQCAGGSLHGEYAGCGCPQVEGA